MKFKALRSVDEEGRRTGRWVELDIGDLAAGEVLIRSRFAAVNYKDAHAVCGTGNVIKRFPCIPGIEVAGEIVESSAGQFAKGDMVTVQGGREFGITHDGAYSEYVRVPAAWVHPIPAGFDAFSVVALGIGAYTSALAIEAIQLHGIKPGDGEILVTGATGGCSSFAINMLSGLGYETVAMTGKPSEFDYLQDIGATRVISREDVQVTHPKPLDQQLWAACIDAVGGAPLDFALRTLKKSGIVAAFGNAAGEAFTTSVYPFILRSVTLVGINADAPVDRRTGAWMRLTHDLKPGALAQIVQRVRFEELPQHCEQLIAGQSRGRVVVCF